MAGACTGFLHDPYSMQGMVVVDTQCEYSHCNYNKQSSIIIYCVVLSN